MVGGQSPPSLRSLTSHNMNVSTMIDHPLPTHAVPSHPLPSRRSAPPHPHSHQLPSVSAHLSHSQPLQFRSHRPSAPPPPLPKLPPLSSRLPPIPTVSQPTYHQPLSSIQSVLPYSSTADPHPLAPQHPQQHLSSFQPTAVTTTDPTRFPPPSRVEQPPKYLPPTFHDTSPLSRPDRVAPLSLPLPPTKSVYSDPYVSYDHTAQPTVSPVSVAQATDAYCVSPVSTTHPADYPAAPAGPRRAPIDDSLIARLRGFNGNRPAPPVPITRGEPQIRDTSESLAMGYVDTVPGRDLAQLASQTDAVTVSPDRPHACRKCSATFRRRDNLMAHIRAQHKGERPFKCEVCGFRFIKKDHAMKHWKVVHLKERPFVCTRCNSRFGQRSDLNKHVRSVHLRIKPFECEHCGLRFSHRGNQIRHQAVVHEKKKPFTCTECSSSFAEKSNLLKHCQAVHKSGVLFSS